MTGAGSSGKLPRVDVPHGMQVAFQGKADSMREIAQQLREAGIEHATGPLPGG